MHLKSLPPIKQHTPMIESKKDPRCHWTGNGSFRDLGCVMLVVANVALSRYRLRDDDQATERLQAHTILASDSLTFSYPQFLFVIFKLVASRHFSQQTLTQMTSLALFSSLRSHKSLYTTFFLYAVVLPETLKKCPRIIL